jgi:hypothetical protein
MRASLRFCAVAATVGLGTGPAPACDGHCGYGYGYYYAPRAHVYYAPPPVYVYARAPRFAYSPPPAYSYYAPTAYEVYTRVDVYRGPRWGSAYHGPPVVFGPAWTRGYGYYGACRRAHRGCRRW